MTDSAFLLSIEYSLAFYPLGIGALPGSPLHKSGDRSASFPSRRLGLRAGPGLSLLHGGGFSGLALARRPLARHLLQSVELLPNAQGREGACSLPDTGECASVFASPWLLLGEFGCSTTRHFWSHQLNEFPFKYLPSLSRHNWSSSASQ